MLLCITTTMSDNHDDRNRLFHVDSRRIQSQDDDQSQPYRWTILQALDGITSSYFGILIAVIVVGLVHFRGRLSFPCTTMLTNPFLWGFLPPFSRVSFPHSQTVALFMSSDTCRTHSRMAPVLSRPSSRKDPLGNSPANRSLVPISRSRSRCLQEISKCTTESPSTTNEYARIGKHSNE
jgi:hypothetical protein